MRITSTRISFETASERIFNESEEVMKRVLCILAIGLVAVRLSTGPRKARADGGCSVKSLTGPYSFSSNGFYTVGGNTGDVLELGRMLFDGAGNLSGIETASADGTIVQNFSFTGNYTVGSDCTGSATFLTNGVQSPVNLIVTANGAMAQYISTRNGFSVAGTLYQIGSPPQ